MERRIWREQDPIILYQRAMDALGGDPLPLLTACASKIPEISEEARERLVGKLETIFPTNTEKTFLEFMDFVKTLREEYAPLSDIGWTNVIGWRDVCGLWFNRRRQTYRLLWACWRALYTHAHNLPLPKECYDALGSSTSEGLDWAYTEQADQVDRQGIKHGWTGLLNG